MKWSVSSSRSIPRSNGTQQFLLVLQKFLLRKTIEKIFDLQRTLEKSDYVDLFQCGFRLGPGAEIVLITLVDYL